MQEEIKSHAKPVISVCLSGYRIGEVATFLSGLGIDVINGSSRQNAAELINLSGQLK